MVQAAGFEAGVAARYLPCVVAGLVLLVAALLPASDEETRGSMWPLMGCSNAIDPLYVRGLRWQRNARLGMVDRRLGVSPSGPKSGLTDRNESNPAFFSPSG